MRPIRGGQWRDDADGPMQVVSGPVARQRVHYAAPPAARLADEMSAFLGWFEGSHATDPVLAAGVAHLWFVTVHPFEDGNGRIARALADMALARSEKSPERAIGNARNTLAAVSTTSATSSRRTAPSPAARSVPSRPGSRRRRAGASRAGRSSRARRFGRCGPNATRSSSAPE